MSGARTPFCAILWHSPNASPFLLGSLFVFFLDLPTTLDFSRFVLLVGVHLSLSLGGPLQRNLRQCSCDTPLYRREVEIFRSKSLIGNGQESAEECSEEPFPLSPLPLYLSAIVAFHLVRGGPMTNQSLRGSFAFNPTLVRQGLSQQVRHPHLQQRSVTLL